LKYAKTAEEAVLFFEEMKRKEVVVKHWEETSENKEGYAGKRKRREVSEISRTWSVIEKNVRETFEVPQTSNAPPLQTSKVIARHEAIQLQTNILFQEYLTGGGYGFFGLYDKGVFKQGFAHKRIREFPMSGGASACAESIEEEELTLLGRRILDAVAWHGLAMVEFKKDEAGQFRLLEVNPKLWGSFDLSVAAGVPFTEKWVQLAMNQPIEPHKDYEKGIQFSWLMEGDMQHGWQTGNLLQILRGVLFDKKTRTNLTWRDPLASLFLIASGLKRR
jgi:hypothetical protein